MHERRPGIYDNIIRVYLPQTIYDEYKSYIKKKDPFEKSLAELMALQIQETLVKAGKIAPSEINKIVPVRDTELGSESLEREVKIIHFVRHHGKVVDVDDPDYLIIEAPPIHRKN